MPIKPENKKLYPTNWKGIRANILKRADNECEFCFVRNGAIGYRTSDGSFYEASLSYDYDFYEDRKLIKIVLTIAHLDHDPTNNDPKNLAALCQRCHNRYDSLHRKTNARKTRRDRKAIGDFFQ